VVRLDHEVVHRLIDNDLLAGTSVRGLVWHDPQAGEHYATAAGIVLLAKDPSAVFPRCRILVDAYRGAEPDGNANYNAVRPRPTMRPLARISANMKARNLGASFLESEVEMKARMKFVYPWLLCTAGTPHLSASALGQRTQQNYFQTLRMRPYF
jgi:hypothetical protein